MSSAPPAPDARGKAHTPTAGAPQPAIICLDLDGTSVESDGLHVWFSERVADMLNEACRHGALWCSNSGRRAENQFGLIQACRRLEQLPFAILSGERYIHDIHRSRTALIPRQPHCDRARAMALELMPRVKAAIEPRLAGWTSEFPKAEFYPADEFVGWQANDTAESIALQAAASAALSAVPDAQVLRNGAWVIVTHARFGKGGILTTAAAEMGISRDRILAVGDQPNDLDMLDGRSAAFPGCPADADDSVIATVRRAGGWIAESPGCQGTAELIRRFLEVGPQA